MKKKFIVSYEIDFIHRVTVGIEALDESEAPQRAEQAFNDATLWDDAEALQPLSDEYHEAGDESMAWECEAVEHYPEPDHSVQQLYKDQAAFRVCRGLIEAYHQGEISGGSIQWEDRDQWIP